MLCRARLPGGLSARPVDAGNTPIAFGLILGRPRASGVHMPCPKTGRRIARWMPALDAHPEHAGVLAGRGALTGLLHPQFFAVVTSTFSRRGGAPRQAPPPMILSVIILLARVLAVVRLQSLRCPTICFAIRAIARTRMPSASAPPGRALLCPAARRPFDGTPR
jgi:hypothetical protein